MLLNLLPEVILLISTHLDFFDKLELRKTCRKFHNMISKTTLFEELDLFDYEKNPNKNHHRNRTQIWWISDKKASRWGRNERMEEYIFQDRNQLEYLQKLSLLKTLGLPLHSLLYHYKDDVLKNITKLVFNLRKDEDIEKLLHISMVLPIFHSLD
ncbi:hypothetical protein K501DRAFT_269733 [Backusella circina FSU 941]|nr:hypothetical protein K501DRAFT_269733 [Backusella circina FSU 941]